MSSATAEFRAAGFARPCNPEGSVYRSASVGAAVIDVDAQLVARAQSGDELAFEELVRRHANRLHGVLSRIVGDSHAEDVTQETFIRAWRAIDRFDGDSQFFTWLYRIGVNEARRRLERNRRGVLRGLRSLDSDSFDPPDARTGPDIQAEQADFRRALEQAVQKLPLVYRAPLVLRDIEGLSTTEAASILGIGEAAFKSRLHRARLAVRKSLGSYLTEADA